MNWTLLDFVTAAALVGGAVISYLLLSRLVRSTTHKALIGVTVFGLLLLVWAELAVGLIGTPFAGQ